MYQPVCDGTYLDSVQQTIFLGLNLKKNIDLTANLKKQIYRPAILCIIVEWLDFVSSECTKS